MTIWRQLLEETLGAISVYGFLAMFIQRINAGIGSEAENELLANIKKVILEYKTKGLSENKRNELSAINTMQREYDKKWGVQDSGHVIHTLITQKPSPAP